MLFMPSRQEAFVALPWRVTQVRVAVIGSWEIRRSSVAVPGGANPWDTSGQAWFSKGADWSRGSEFSAFRRVREYPVYTGASSNVDRGNIPYGDRAS